MKQITYLLSAFTFLILLTSCEGFKVLTIHNTSNTEAKITVRPGLEYSNNRQINNNQKLDSTVVVLQPGSSIKVLSTFTGLLFNVKIKERELRTDYLKIETPTDTTVAHSRKEIIDLIYSNRKGTIKGEGRNFAKINIE